MSIPALLILLFSVPLLHATTTRESFDHGWKFARFGKMPGGTVLAGPGNPCGR
jgi:hypothetical protein